MGPGRDLHDPGRGGTGAVRSPAAPVEVRLVVLSHGADFVELALGVLADLEESGDLLPPDRELRAELRRSAERLDAALSEVERY